MNTRLRSAAIVIAIATCGCGLRSPFRRSLSPSLHEPGPDGLYGSVLVTAHPANETRFDVSKQGHLVYVSRRDGNADLWLRAADPRAVGEPERLTVHSAVDDSPALSPDGRRLAFVTHREDARGDIAVMKVRGLSDDDAAARSDLEILTDREGADRDPCWVPSGERIAFSRTPASGGAEEVYELSLKDRALKQMTDGGGRGPSYSPDGQYLAYSSTKDDPSGRIWVMRVAGGQAAPLTAGSAIDGFPSWSEDGKWVYFARFSEDTNGDGGITTQDNASIWRVAFNGLRGAGGRKEVQLTSGRFFDLYPRVRGGLLYYATNQQGNFDIAVTNSEGTAPTPATAPDGRQLAQRTLNALPPSPYTSIVVLRRLLSDPPADLVSERDQQQLRAYALLEVSKQYAGLKLRGHAMEALDKIEQSCSEAPEKVHEARIRLQAHKAAEAQAADDREGLSTAVKAIEAIGRSADLSPHVRAFAWVTAGDVYASAKELDKAARCYGELFGADGKPQFPEAKVLTAEAALKKVNSQMRLMGKEAGRSQLKKLYWDIIERHAEVRHVYLEAARNILDLELEGREYDHERLRQTIREHRDQSVLAAMAQNRLADLYYRQRRIANAKHEYQKVAGGELFPKEAEQIAAAKFALAHIHYQQGEYKECLDIYGQLTDQERQGNMEIFHLARRAYIQSTLDKADRELRLRDLHAARKTYRELLALDWRFVLPDTEGDDDPPLETFTAFDWKLVEAHRGYIDCQNEINKIPAKRGRKIDTIRKVMQFYEKQAALATQWADRVERGEMELPRNRETRQLLVEGLTNAQAVARYCIGLARSYVGSPKTGVRKDSLARAEQEILEAVRIRPAVPYCHQTLGWIHKTRYDQSHKPEDRIWLQKAIGRYQRAVSLVDKENDKRAYADLLLNLGHAYRDLGNYAKAYDYYAEREQMDPEGRFFRHDRREALFHRSYSDTARKKRNPDYSKAIELSQKAIAVMDRILVQTRGRIEQLPSEEQRDRGAGVIEEFQTHKADLWAIKGQSHQELRRHEDAITAFRAANEIYTRVGDREKARLSLRNVAYNTYRLAQSQPTENRKLLLLERARAIFGEAIPAEGSGAPKDEGALTIKTEVALGENATQAAKGFDPEMERRMIFTFDSRIYESAEDYLRAIDGLERRLGECPEDPAKGKRDAVNAEKALLFNQIATYETHLGRYGDALGHYRDSLRLAEELELVHGIVVNSANTGQVVLRLLGRCHERTSPAPQAQAWLDEARKAQARALALIEELAKSDDEPDYAHPEYRVYLQSNLAALAQRASALGLELTAIEPVKKGDEG